MRRGEKAVYYIAPAIIFLVAMSIFPLLYSLVTSFQEMDLAGRFPTRFVGLKNYIQILHDGRFLNSLKVTFLYTTIAVGLEIVLGFILALLLWHEFRGFSRQHGVSQFRYYNFTSPLGLGVYVARICLCHLLHP
jgi:ABC-type sugar transport system permease subunit